MQKQSELLENEPNQIVSVCTKVFFCKTKYTNAIRDFYQDQYDFNIWNSNLNENTQNTVKEIVYLKKSNFENGVTDFSASVVLIKSSKYNDDGNVVESKLDRFVLLGENFDFDDEVSLEEYCSSGYNEKN